MIQEERDLIVSLFDRLAPAASQPRDREAEALITTRVAANPAATYLLAQMALVHEHALRGAQNRITELEQQVAEIDAREPKSGSFLGGLLTGTAWARKEPGSAAATAVRAGSVPGVGGRGITLPSQPMLAGDRGAPMPMGSVPPAGAAQYGRGGPSFLQGALTTAAGVAGGMVLGNMLVNMLSHNAGSPIAEAAAAAHPHEPPAPPSDVAAAPSPWNTAATGPEPAHHDEPAAPDHPIEHEPAFETAQDDGHDFGSDGGFDGGSGGGDSESA